MAGGRPRKDISEDQFKKLCFLQCTLEEIAGFFECSADTVESWCKRELDMGFSEAFKRHSAGGKLSLRRAQFRLAEKNAGMAIFLGKQYLGQKDSFEYTDNSALEKLGEILDGIKVQANADTDAQAE